MTSEMAVLIGFTLFLSFIFYFSLRNMREAYRSSTDSLIADKKILAALLKDAQNRIHASSLSDYLTLSGRDAPEVREPMRRNDAIEAEIAARTGGSEM